MYFCLITVNYHLQRVLGAVVIIFLILRQYDTRRLSAGVTACALENRIFKRTSKFFMMSVPNRYYNIELPAAAVNRYDLFSSKVKQRVHIRRRHHGYHSTLV